MFDLPRRIADDMPLSLRSSMSPVYFCGAASAGLLLCVFAGCRRDAPDIKPPRVTTAAARTALVASIQDAESIVLHVPLHYFDTDFFDDQGESKLSESESGTFETAVEELGRLTYGARIPSDLVQAYRRRYAMLEEAFAAAETDPNIEMFGVAKGEAFFTAACELSGEPADTFRTVLLDAAREARVVHDEGLRSACGPQPALELTPASLAITEFSFDNCETLLFECDGVGFELRLVDDTLKLAVLAINRSSGE